MTPVERLLAKLPGARKTPTGWSAHCPAHEDRQASLSIAEGHDGRTLLYCHAGCSQSAVVQALGLSMADLYPIAPTNGAPRAKGAATGSTFATATEAVAELERRHGLRSDLWTYQDASGEPIGVVVRWNLADGKKDIRPVSRHGDGWRIGGMPEPRPLYGLPDLAGAQRVYVCEGEKAADAARAIDLTATTSAHGSQSADKTDWSPLAGKEVVILPDHDAAGEKYARDVAAILTGPVPATWVKKVELPGLPEGGDIVDWIDSHGDAAEPLGMRCEIEALVQAAPRWTAPSNTPKQRQQPTVQAYESFPVATIPEPVRRFVIEAADAIGCDTSYVAAPLLVALAAAVGNTRRIQLKPGWCEPCVVWCAIVGESGTLKSPAFDAALGPMRRRQTKSLSKHDQALTLHERELQIFEADSMEWRKTGRKKGEPAPLRPTEPIANRNIVADVTVEAIIERLAENPRGLLLERDELAGWIGSFNQYKGGRGGDVPNWLSMHRAGQVLADRKTGSKKTIFAPRGAVSVCGGIQPEVLRLALAREHFEDGLGARLLLAMPPVKTKRWTDAVVDTGVESEVDAVFDRLLALDFIQGCDGDLIPLDLPLSPRAKAAWVEWYNAHAQAQAELSGDLAAAWSKLEGYAARLALVVHLVRVAADDPTLQSRDAIDEVSIQAGAAISDWFAGEARRVYGMLGESDEDCDQRQLVELIERRGGRITARELMHASRQYRGSAGDAEAALDSLVRARHGAWQTAAGDVQGGRPTRVFVLTENSNGNTTTKIPEESEVPLPLPTNDEENQIWTF